MTGINPNVGGSGTPSTFTPLGAETMTPQKPMTGVDTQNKYESGDSISSSIPKPNINAQKDDYSALSDRPELSQPRNNVSNQEYSASDKILIKQKFADQVDSQLDGYLDGYSKLPDNIKAVIADAIANANIESLPSNLQEIAKEVQNKATAVIKENYNLGDKWSPHSSDPAVWTYTFNANGVSAAGNIKGENSISDTGAIKDGAAVRRSGVGNVYQSPPLTVEERKTVMSDYKEYLSAATSVVMARSQPPLTENEIKLLKEAVKTGVPDASIKTIYDEVIELSNNAVQYYNSLPTSWDGTKVSLEAEGYYNQALQDSLNEYIAAQEPPLTDTEVELLKISIETGKIAPAVAKHFEAVSKLAEQVIQDKFNIPGWTMKEVNKTWTPDSVSPVNPGQVNQAMLNALTQGAVKMLEGFSNIAQNLIDKLDVNDPNRMVLKDFLTAISSALQEMKEALREMQIFDAEKQKNLNKNKMDTFADRRQDMINMEKKMEESRAKQQQMANLALAGKIIAPILTAIINVVGFLISLAMIVGSLALTAATFGVGSPTFILAIIATAAVMTFCIALSTAILGYTIADSCTGCSAKIFEAYSKAVDSMFPDGPKWAAELTKALIILTAVAILIVVAAALIIALIVLSQGAATGALASLATQLAKEVIKALIGIAIQAAMALLLQSNVIPNLVETIARDVSKHSAEVVQKLRLAATITQAVVAGVGALLLGAGQAGAGGINAAVSSGMSVVKVASEQGIKAAAQMVLEGIKEALREVITKISTYFKSLTAPLQEQIIAFLTQMATPIKSIYTSVSEMKEQLKSVLEGVKTFKDISGSFASSMDDCGKSTASLLTIVLPMVQGSSYAFQGAQALTSAIIKVGIYQITKDQADLQAAIELLSELIKMLTNLLNNIGKGQQNIQDIIKGISDYIMNNLFGGASRSLNNLMMA